MSSFSLRQWLLNLGERNRVVRTAISLYRAINQWRYNCLDLWERRRVSRQIDAKLAHYPIRERPILAQARQEQIPSQDEFPLVSVIIATWNRGPLLAERTIPTVLNQTWPNWELIVVGDGCTDDTPARMARFTDPRVRFENLAERGVYPTEPHLRRLVQGLPPMVRAESLARGQWIAHLDDDDCFTPDHIEVMMRAAQADERVEYLWGRMDFEVEPAVWRVEGSPTIWLYDMPHSAVMFRNYLREIPYLMEAWRYELGDDRHRFRRWHLAGARGKFVDQIVTRAPLRPGTTRPWGNAEDVKSL